MSGSFSLLDLSIIDAPSKGNMGWVCSVRRNGGVRAGSIWGVKIEEHHLRAKGEASQRTAMLGSCVQAQPDISNSIRVLCLLMGEIPSWASLVCERLPGLNGDDLCRSAQ